MRIKKVILVGLVILLAFAKGFSQTPKPAVNNLVHTPGYKTAEWGTTPQYIKAGKGKKTLVLIPGWGFDASVYKDFMEANKKEYTMYAVTIPGFGNTNAPAMPTGKDTSYGEQYWNKGFITGLFKLFEKEKIQQPIIVGHFTQGAQLALRIAVDYPDKVSGVIVIGGQAKFIMVMQGQVRDLPLSQLIKGTDMYTAPLMFKTTSKKDWDEGNYAPEIYSLDSIKGKKLWQQSAKIPVPVMVHYLMEFHASDLKAELVKIKCPVLVLRPMFTTELLEATSNNYVKPQYIDTWNGASEKNPLIQVKDIQNAATFVWKDKPAEVNKSIKEFVSGIK
jgi:pimeloyl-ACP methyl ester carboxylesterase